jgi:hypothetical protein
MGGVRNKKIKTYTIEELQAMLQTFEDTHPEKGTSDEWYGDNAMMKRESAEEFLNWVKEQ